MNMNIAYAAQPLADAVNVASYAQLVAAINDTPVGESVSIAVTAGFTITGTVTINGGRYVTLSSGAGGPYTLTRGATGHMFVIAAVTDSALALNNIILDGNSAAYPNAGGALVRGEINSVLTIGPGAELINNRNTSGPGAVYAASTELRMTGGRIADNYGSFGGGIRTDSSSFTMTGGVIENNTAQYDGGGVQNAFQPFFMYNGIIRNNAALVQQGGGIAMDGGVLTIYDGLIQDNSAARYGGGIAIGAASGSLTMYGGVIDGNTVTGEGSPGIGGGIVLISSSPTVPNYDINGSVVFSKNTAPNGGGAIGLLYDEQYEKLNIGPDVVFENNGADQAYLINPADIPLHNAHVHTHAFTEPFTYGYNNFDILYTRGTPVNVIHVTFDSEGGSLVPGQVVLQGESIARPADPMRPGYTFGGWYSDAALTMPWDFSAPVMADTVLYARWIPRVTPPKPPRPCGCREPKPCKPPRPCGCRSHRSCGCRIRMCHCTPNEHNTAFTCRCGW